MKTASQLDKSVARLIVVEGSVNLLILVAKTVVGLSTGSLAVLGDAVHSLTDVANNAVAWTVIRLSGEPADHEHPYGHRKFETLAVFGLAAVLVAFGFELVVQAATREYTEIASGSWEVALMLGVLAVNVGLATWQRHWAQKLKSDILLADASHTFADVLTTIAVIVGWQLSTVGYLWLDRACAFGVAGVIFYLAYGLFKRSIPILVDEFAVDPVALKDAVRQVEEVDKVVRVRSRWMGSARAVDMIVAVNPKMSTLDAHCVADKIEALLQRQFGVQDVSIHIEPSEYQAQSAKKSSADRNHNES